MNTDKQTARVAGTLFILATAAALAGSAVLGSMLSAPDYLSRISADGNRVLVSALLSVLAAFLSAGIALALYPVVRKFNEGLAVSSVGFRLIEGVFYIVGAMCLVLLVPVSQQVGEASGQELGHLLVTAKELAGFVFGVLAFCIGGSAYYSVFYRSNMVPRWLSVWGLIAQAMLFAAALITLFDGEPYSVSGGLIYLAFPIALQEMVLAVWLIVKGFNETAATASI